mgnify:CR=1 FL=1
MDEKLLLKAVVLAGEIMLSSGAEVSRVENTMQFMLRRSNCEVTEAVVLATGLFVTMADPGGEPMTFSKRIPARSTNINRICRVNEVSRQFCHMELTVEEAYEELKRIQKEILYKPWMKLAGIIGISVSFIFIYGGNFLDLSTWWGSVWRRRTGSQRSSGSMISVPRPSAGLWWPFLLCSSRNSVLLRSAAM